MRSLYHPSIHDTEVPIGSHWLASVGPPGADFAPLDGDARCEVAIIGGGYTGLSAALTLAAEAGIEARVLEAGPPGWGASGRNGGFCGLGGSKLSLAAMTRRYGEDATRRYYAAGVEAIALVRTLAADEGIDIEAPTKGGKTEEGEICVAHRANRMAELAEEAETMTRLTGIRHETWSRDELAERAFRGPEAHGALYCSVGFGLHPLKFVRGLAAAAVRHGARVHAHSPVVAWRREGGEHRLITPGGSLRARRVLVAANGFLRDDLHPAFAGRLLPALSSIITTRPLSAAERAAQGWRTGVPIYDSRTLLFYFRLLPDGRFLFGARGGSDASPAGAARLRSWMERRLGAMFPAWRGVEIAHAWRGLIGLSPRRVPHLGRLDGEIYHSLAYHGSGVALATWCGRAIARVIAGRPQGEVVPEVMRTPLGRFLAPGLRRYYLKGAYAYHGVLDEWW